MSMPAEYPVIPQRVLRNEISRVLREVAAGDSYTVTVEGAPVADLVPHRAGRRTAVPRDEMLAAFRTIPPGDARGGDMAADDHIDDSLYDPYDRAFRRGPFAAGDAE
ncbi:putative prevent-host-death family protein [Nocardia nova SH22a]|uniref:Putative prevent-host-death family protein n=1 Tax=Nocardia nova SH22a TaxID=1415166 RepID=W5TRL3_9NOCA|nr:putative prevent-host-death family protein [Nocardia nova SH22a]